MQGEPTTFDRLKTMLTNEPLVEAVPTIEHMSPTICERQGGALYYGTGLTTPRALSIGLPFDVLGMVLVANKLRTALHLETMIHHIADTHALANPFATQDRVDELAEQAESVMQRVARVLEIPDFRVIRSSSFDTDQKYLSLLESIQTEKGEYVRRELADMLWYKQQHGLVLKMGWIIQATKAPEGFDERLYDEEFIRLHGPELSFAYLKAGRTFDQKRPKASPYISVPDEQRILLAPHEKVQEKITAAMSLWPDKQLGGAVNHLNNIVRLFERTIGQVSKGTLSEKIQRIIDRIFE